MLDNWMQDVCIVAHFFPSDFSLPSHHGHCPRRSLCDQFGIIFPCFQHRGNRIRRHGQLVGAVSRLWNHNGCYIVTWVKSANRWHHAGACAAPHVLEFPVQPGLAPGHSTNSPWSTWRARTHTLTWRAVVHSNRGWALGLGHLTSRGSSCQNGSSSEPWFSSKTLITS